MIKLDELVEEHGVVGAQVAVLHNGEIVDMAAGVLNNVTGEEVTTDSIFQIGSITKVWTATLVQELVNEGLLDLDRPVRDVLPEFRLADEQAARIITPRHLLTHTGGFDGDLWHDTGSGDDKIEKYVELMADARQVVAPGEFYTYCNSGFVVLGRIVEVLRGKPFNTVLRERLIEPLGLRTAATSHAEYAAQTCATGHLGKELKPAEKLMTEGDAPAGSVLAMSARDLAAFARMHLDTGEFVAMRETQVVMPNFGLGGTQGLGWIVQRYADGQTGVGHTGSTLGFEAYLRVMPSAGIAIVVLTNGGQSLPLVRAVFQKVLGDLAGVTLSTFPTPPLVPVPVDVEKVVGVYRSAGMEAHVSEGDGGRVRLRFVALDHVFAALVDDEEREFTGLRDDALIAVEKEDGYHPVIVLCGRDEQDRVKYLHWGRAARRV
ncbi:serine hydrolase domain-containing protein [Lentzea flaviverrucosa]|uniref:CubicO group peptidase, beta-lactamase class C family n=1 Tax=Lentzea flaviverrucosa TaxID=200379 RepID=A0A1H9XQ04_9PSEU|nr:serine hydrolase domain-containing protein [Lentzea flaviverrucosa]RDI19735.1 CubicO group peptidase (beta-lactamase class C family) [Lentzea flaviverrucosa]SES48099.1 CubicO group peptidase, beta-lactamase class C family [Lentzea flaviverrucosa]